MKLMTTHHLGQQPGRARLGACGHLPVRTRTSGLGANWAGNWADQAAPCPMPVAYGASVATTTFGQDSIKRPTRYLGARST